jgi:predicted GIY-YIG superfamily endonuclease
MKYRAQTIQIFLPAGDPRGIRIAEITTRIVQLVEVPRSLLSDFIAMPESAQVAAYFLFGESEENASPKVYIGQTGDLRKRLMSHNKEKDFWQRCLVLVSKTHSLTQTHALFLEWLCIQDAKKIGRYVVENGNDGSRPHTPAPLEADCIEILETGKTLLSTLGYPLFESISKPLEVAEKEEILYLTRGGCEAQGEYRPEGFVVFKNSLGRSEVTPSFSKHTFFKLRNDLVAQGKIAIEGEKLVFHEDILFSTPSGAAAVVCGGAANGWTEWKNAQGKTLDQLKRTNNTND